MVGFYTFSFALAITLICLVLFPYMEKKSYFRHYANMGKFEDDKEQLVTLAMVKQVSRNCWGFFSALLLLGISTNMVYPSATALIEPVNPNDTDFHELYFTQVL